MKKTYLSFLLFIILFLSVVLISCQGKKEKVSGKEDLPIFRLGLGKGSKELIEAYESLPGGTRNRVLEAAYTFLGGEPSLALDMIRTDLEHFPSNLFLLYLKAKVLMEMGRFDEAEELIKKGPLSNLEMLHSLMAHCLLKAGKMDMALPYFKEAADRAPDNPWILRDYAMALYQTGQFSVSAKVMQKVMKIVPDDPGLMGDLASIYFFQGKKKKALELLEKSLEFEPDNLINILTYAYILESMKKYEQAQESANLALDYALQDAEDMPESWDVQIDLAWAFLRAGLLNDALEQVNAQLKIQPGNPSALDLKGAILSRLGKKDRALGILARLLSIDPYRAVFIANDPDYQVLLDDKIHGKMARKLLESAKGKIRSGKKI